MLADDVSDSLSGPTRRVRHSIHRGRELLGETVGAAEFYDQVAPRKGEITRLLDCRSDADPFNLGLWHDESLSPRSPRRRPLDWLPPHGRSGDSKMGMLESRLEGNRGGARLSLKGERPEWTPDSALRPLVEGVGELELLAFVQGVGELAVVGAVIGGRLLAAPGG